MAQILAMLRQRWLQLDPGVTKKISLSDYLLRATRVIEFIRSLGANDTMREYERRKLGIFNQLCFLQLLTGIAFPVFAIFHQAYQGTQTWFLAVLPPAVTLLVLWLNYHRKTETALYSYFILYPLSICVVYLNRVDMGIELSFILCGILAVFFLTEVAHIVFAIGFSMVSYFALFLIRRETDFPPLPIDSVVYILNEVVTIIFIFYALYLIMKENVGFQFRLINKNRNLHAKNLEIERQQEEIREKAELLEKQAGELQELDRLKNKLFSIVAHDLKAPMFALRNLFQQMAVQNTPAEELETLVPTIVNDLNYSTALVENLLEWAKSQMQSSNTLRRNIDVNKLVDDTVQLLLPQLRSKKISIIRRTDTAVYAYADENMIRLVFRNLLSNAVKFTPEGGKIIVGTTDLVSCVEVYVKDTGKGISRDEMQKINQNIFYTTHGTKNESGTGLGLMLCKEFLQKNESRLLIESEPGEGSTFSFALKTA